MEGTPNEVSALATLNMLEERLHRLEFLLHGSANAVGIPDPAPVPVGRDDTVSTRLAGLQSGLQRLSSKHGLVKDILEMREMSSSVGQYHCTDRLPKTRNIRICLFQLPTTPLQQP